MPQSRPHLSFCAVPKDPAAIVLVLHGGQRESVRRVRAGDPAVLRMVPIARRIARGGHGRFAVIRLRYAVHGWNGELQSPLADANWALDQLTEQFGSLPIGLVGHSLGGRTALRLAGHPEVQSVVALAPWLPEDEPLTHLTGRRVLLVHGSKDRMILPISSVHFTERLRTAGLPASLVEISGGGHSMVRRARLWNQLAAGFVLGTVASEQGLSAGASEPDFLRRVVQGEDRIRL